MALLLTEPALGHVDVRPRLVEQGTATTFRIELPQLRAGPPPVRLEVEGNGIEVLSTRLQTTVGAETAWTVQLQANAAPGVVPLVLRAVYADGQSVEVDQQLTVVPAPDTTDFPWPAAIVGGLLAVSFAAVALFLVRRRA